MNARKVADELQECIDDGSTDLVCVQEAATVIRQQADRIEALEAKHKRHLNMLAKQFQYIKQLEQGLGLNEK